MESSVVTLSQAADMIIVTCFCTAGYFAFLYLISEAICGLISFIRAKRKKRKELEAKKTESKDKEKN